MNGVLSGPESYPNSPQKRSARLVGLFPRLPCFEENRQHRRTRFLTREKRRIVLCILKSRGVEMLDNVPCAVGSASELDAKIREIFSLDMQQRGDEICGVLNVYYSDESVRQAGLIPTLEARGVEIVWHRTA